MGKYIAIAVLVVLGIFSGITYLSQAKITSLTRDNAALATINTNLNTEMKDKDEQIKKQVQSVSITENTRAETTAAIEVKTTKITEISNKAANKVREIEKSYDAKPVTVKLSAEQRLKVDMVNIQELWDIYCIADNNVNPQCQQ